MRACSILLAVLISKNRAHIAQADVYDVKMGAAAKFLGSKCWKRNVS